MPCGRVSTGQWPKCRTSCGIAAEVGGGRRDGVLGRRRLRHASRAGELDAAEFEALLARGRRELTAGRPQEAAATLRSALSLWRGPALVDVRARLFAQPEIARLSGLRLECTVERLAADLDAGAGADVIAELDAMVVEHPLNERIRELQMLALYRAGRQTDALAAYRDARRVLSREHGLDPGGRLRDLEAAILRHDVPAPAGIAAADVNGTDRRRVTCRRSA